MVKEQPQGGWEEDAGLSQWVADKWVEMAPALDRMMDRIGESDAFPIARCSALVGDDTASTPYLVSYAAQACLSAAVDHLHAAKVLAYDSGVLHLGAPATLARAAIENAATGLWILTPNRRDERVLRASQWFSQNYRDAAKFGPIASSRTLQSRLEEISAVAARRNLKKSEAVGGYQLSKAIEAVDLAYPGLGAKAAWQIGSGFAHGRPWAYLGALIKESPGPGVDGLQLTNDPILAMYPILTGFQVLKHLLEIQDLRAGWHRKLTVDTRQSAGRMRLRVASFRNDCTG